MKKLRSYFAAIYKNSKLKVKLLINISLIMVIALAFVLGGLQYVFNLYDEQLYEKSSQVLMMSSNSIEEELERIEVISYSIAVNSQLQKSLLELQDNIDGYEFYRLEQQIENELANYAGSEKYIQSILLYDSNGREFLAGSSSSPLLQSDKEAALKTAGKYKGENHWIEIDGYNEFLISVRLVRSYENLNLRPIGTLLIRVNLDKIVGGLPLTRGEAAGNILISNGDQVFYSAKGTDGLDEFHFNNRSDQGYRIEKINGERFFVNHLTTSFGNWTYWNIIPFNQMFSGIAAAKYSIIFVFLLMFFLLITLGFKFLRRITNPIEELAATMQDVKQGDFQAVEALNPSLIYEDEVGILYRNFITMVQRIDELIQENYAKQLLIKETEFNALQAQINPHFLYNTLESVNWLAKTHKQQQISNMVEALGHLMRNSINFKEDIITIGQELQIADSYLTIQKYRFDDRLDVQMDIDPSLMGCRIPKLTLQPLLENSFQHAVEPSLGMSIIKLAVCSDGQNLLVRVEDNGPGVDPGILAMLKTGKFKPKGTGIGLNNINERIMLSFGEQYGLRVENLSGKGTAITVVLPLQEVEADGV
jgi:two-component system, sensor histidine kinase YesM